MTDAEINVACARLMGWRSTGGFSWSWFEGDHPRYMNQNRWDPSFDMNQAMQVVAWILQNSNWDEFRFRSHEHGQQWGAGFRAHKYGDSPWPPTDNYTIEAEADSPAKAACLAAIKAMGPEEKSVHGQHQDW